VPQPVRHLRQVLRAGLVPALNLPWVFPLLSLRLEHVAAFELQTTCLNWSDILLFIQYVRKRENKVLYF